MGHWPRALVTGASSGIGESFARQLAAQGTDLILVARRSDRLEELASELRSGHGVATEVLQADLTDHAQLATVEARVAAREDPVDLLVNNAGFAVAGNAGTNDIESEVMSIELNVIALVRLTHAALTQMRPRDRGWIANVSSVGAFQPSPGLSTYGATKAFVNSYSEGIYEELRGTGVHITAVCPGFTRTEFQQVAGEATEASNMPDFLWQTADEVVSEALAKIPGGPALVITGRHNQATVGAVGLLPRRVVRWIAGQATRRM